MNDYLSGRAAQIQHLLAHVMPFYKKQSAFFEQPLVSMTPTWFLGR
jgi:hypothetical protein